MPAKVPKLSCPSAVRVHEELFSVRTISRDDRCFVLKEGDFWICLRPECKNLRAMYVSSDWPAELHVRTLDSSPNAWVLVEDSLLMQKKLPPTHQTPRRRSC